MADNESSIRAAIQAILAADSTVQTLCGRATDVVRRRGAFGDAATLPMGLWEVLRFDEVTGRADVLVTGVADGGADDAVPRNLVRAMVDALTNAAFEAQGVAVVPLGESRESADRGNPDAASALNREGQPMLHQADATLGLLLVSDL